MFPRLPVVRLLLAVLLLALAALTGCAPKKDDPLAIGVRTANDHAPFYIADKLGYYADEGLQVDVQLIPSNTEIVEAIQRGDLQVGVAPITTAIAAIAQGAPIKIVAMTGRGSDGLLVRADSGIQAIGDLRGKRIATIRGSILDVPLRQALDQAGLDPEQDVELVYFNQLGDMIQALKTGQVDASSNTEPFMTEAELQGWGRILSYYTESWPDHPCCVVFVRQDLLDQRPDAVQKLLRTHIRAVDYANAHPRETAEIIVEYLDAFDVDLVEASLAPEKMRIDYRIVAAEVEQMAGLMHAYGLIERQPSTEQLLDLSPLEAAVK